jgi:glutathione S-transferase
MLPVDGVDGGLLLRLILVLLLQKEIEGLTSSGTTTSTIMKQQVRFVTNKMCPYAQKAYIALECAQIPYCMEEISLYGGKNSKPDWFWELNPAGTVPVLVVEAATGDEQDFPEASSSATNNKRRRPTTSKIRVFPDSDLILDEIGSGRLITSMMGQNSALQVIPEQAPEVTRWRTFINKKLIPIGKKAVLGGPKQPLWDLLGEMNDQIARVGDGSSRDGPFLVKGSSSPTIADCHAFPFVWRLDQEYNLSKDFPNISQWLKACQNQPGFRKTIQNAWWWWW